MTNKKRDSDWQESPHVGESVKVTDSEGNVKENLEIVNIRSGDEIQPGTRIIEIREVKK